MKKIKFIMGVCFLAMALPAQSSTLWDSLVDNTLNFYEDQDREAFFDVDGSGGLNEGDVALGYVRIDDHTLPPGPLTANDLYGVFAIEVANVQTIVDEDAGTTAYYITYAPSTVDGLTLADFGVTNTDASSMGAVYEDVNQNLISGAPDDQDGDGRLTIFDFILEITNDTQDLVVGLEQTIDTGDGIDHFVTTAIVVTDNDPLADLSLLEDASITGGIPGVITTVSFHAGLGITWSAAAGGYLEDCAGVTPEKCWERLVEDDKENPADPSLHELLIVNGDTSGANDLLFAGVNPFFSSNTVGGGGQLLDIDFYGVSTNADFSLYPANRVPEPSMIALMGIGLVGMGAMRRRRKT